MNFALWLAVAPQTDLIQPDPIDPSRFLKAAIVSLVLIVLIVGTGLVATWIHKKIKP